MVKSEHVQRVGKFKWTFLFLHNFSIFFPLQYKIYLYQGSLTILNGDVSIHITGNTEIIYATSWEKNGESLHISLNTTLLDSGFESSENSFKLTSILITKEPLRNKEINIWRAQKICFIKTF